MASFGVLDDVKHGIHNTFERMRYKLQKASGVGSGTGNGNGKNSSSSSSSGKDRGYFDIGPSTINSGLYYSPVSQLESSSDNNNNYNNGSMSTSAMANSDIGLLPLEREGSCLQDVLERNGYARDRDGANCNNNNRSPVKEKSSLADAFSSAVAIAQRRDSSQGYTGFLVDLTDDNNNDESASLSAGNNNSNTKSSSQRQKPLTISNGQTNPLFNLAAPPPPAAPVVSTARSLSTNATIAAPSTNNSSRNPLQQSLHRSVSLSNSQSQDLLDIFSAPNNNNDKNQSDFANFDVNGSSNGGQSALTPTPIGFIGQNASSQEAQDPFASILGDFQPQQQQPRARKVPLGVLAGNNTPAFNAATTILPPPPPSSKPSTYSASQLAAPASTRPHNIPVAAATTQPIMMTQQQKVSPSSKTEQPIANFAAASSSNSSTSPSSISFSASTFASAAATTTTTTTSTQSRLGDALGDVFDQLGYSRQHSLNGGPKTMRDLRKDLMAKEMSDDPESVSVRLWVEGKTGNIRALLSTLHEILWDDESRSKWEPIPIHHLVKPSDVRKAYKRAAVIVHPDKLVGTQYERISRLVFIELNEASSEFQKELEQSATN